MTQDMVEQKIVTMLDALQNGVVNIAGQVVKFTPDVVDAGLTVVRLDGIQSLVWSLICLSVLLSVLIFTVKDFKSGNGLFYMSDGGIIFPVFFVCLFCSYPVTWIVSVWTWVQIFEPKLYIAHKLIEKAMQ